MSGDAVFPLPEPEFLWVHALIGLHMSGPSVIADDDEGDWHYAPSNAVPVPFTGYLTAPNPKELDRAASRGTAVDAVCLAPLGTPLIASDWLDATTDSNIPESLRHTFEVGAVRPNLSHLRLLLTRAAYPAPYPD